MSETVTLKVSYSINFDHDVKLPKGKTAADIESFSVRYDELTIRFKDGEEFTQELDQDFSLEMINTKYPDDYSILDEHGRDIDDTDSDQ